MESRMKLIIFALSMIVIMTVIAAIGGSLIAENAAKTMNSQPSQIDQIELIDK